MTLSTIIRTDITSIQTEVTILGQLITTNFHLGKISIIPTKPNKHITNYPKPFSSCSNQQDSKETIKPLMNERNKQPTTNKPKLNPNLQTSEQTHAKSKDQISKVSS